MADPYVQVAENQKRHALSPLDLARLIRRQVDAGESNASVAKQLGMDLTTVAHHLALLTLPPVLDDALRSGRCSSPRTLYELSQLHEEEPDRVAELLASNQPITRDAVAGMRDASAAVPTVRDAPRSKLQQQDRTPQTLARANGLCDRLDATLLRLSKAGLDRVPAEALGALRQRLAEVASRLETSA